MQRFFVTLGLIFSLQVQAGREDHRVWGYVNTGAPLERSGIEGIPGFDIGLEKAHQMTKGDEDLVVAIIDSGLLLDHKDFKNRLWVNEAEKNGLPGVDDDGNGYVDDFHGWDYLENDGLPNDKNGHGTHIGGIIGAEKNDFGISGINHHSKIMVLKFLDAGLGGNFSHAIAALHYAIDNGAKIINCSWVDEVDDLGEGDPEREPDPELVKVIEKARDHNVLIVASAGNDGFDLVDTKNYPASFSIDYDNVISVGALQNRGELWDMTSHSSNYGQNHVDLSAPGEDVVSYYKDGELRPLSGTSMASPFVTGVASLVWSMYPNKTAAQVKETLLKSVTKTPYLRSFFMTGGMVNAEYALLDLMQPLNPEDPYNFAFREEINFVKRYKGKGVTELRYKVPGAKKVALFVNRMRATFSNEIEIYDSKGKLVLNIKSEFSNLYLPTVEGDEVIIKIINKEENFSSFVDLSHMSFIK